MPEMAPEDIFDGTADTFAPDAAPIADPNHVASDWRPMPEWLWVTLLLILIVVVVLGSSLLTGRGGVWPH